MKVFIFLIVLNLMLSCNENEPVQTISEELSDLVAPPRMSIATFYVATDGNDSNPGTFNEPWATWQKAFQNAVQGDTVYIRGGTYLADRKDQYGVYIHNKSGTFKNPINILNYPGETPVLDCSTITSTKDNIGILLLDCRYYYLRGLTVTGISQHSVNAEAIGFAFEQGGSHIIEYCISHSNEGPGFFGYETDTIYLINCDAYNNYDIATAGYSGGQADGFVFCYASPYSYTYLKGCRSWSNSDDGFDCWENEGKVVFENCWAFSNGRGEGDGCGFKLGKTNGPALSAVQRTLINCIAFQNRFVGFNQNGGEVKMTLFNNIAYDNDGTGFELSQGKELITVKNNISYNNGSRYAFSQYVIHDYNSWDSSPPVIISNADFKSIVPSNISEMRQSDGSLPVTEFLMPANGSDLINRGTDVGLPFLGLAPDLGPFESE